MGKQISEKDIKKYYYIKTFGCQMNERDSEKMAAILENKGYLLSSLQDADILIVNSCAVREKPEQKLYSFIGRLIHEKKKDAKLIVCGCVVQYKGKEILNRFKDVDAVLNPKGIEDFEKILKDILNEKRTMHIPLNWKDPHKILPHLENGTSAFVDISYGCSNFCSYCIVPYTRGREISRRKEYIIKEIKMLAQDGVKEITLLGQNVNSYGKDLYKDYSFVDLLYDVSKIDDMRRIRFVTSHPKDFSYSLILAMKDIDKVCEHIHLPIQSGSNRILKLMGRKYTREEYIEKAQFFKEITEGSITTDVIVGFPTETDLDFKQTIDVLEKINFDFSFSFKYSPRPFTAAVSMKGKIPEEIKEKRLQKFQILQEEITWKSNLKDVGKVFDVLVEGKSKRGNLLMGRTRANKVVNFKGHATRGEIVKIIIQEAKKHSLQGNMEDDYVKSGNQGCEFSRRERKCDFTRRFKQVV
jgi:tRNA-2-methylthio-N6-dimethylallyladenosine synthase